MYLICWNYFSAYRMTHGVNSRNFLITEFREYENKFFDSLLCTLDSLHFQPDQMFTAAASQRFFFCHNEFYSWWVLPTCLYPKRYTCSYCWQNPGLNMNLDPFSMDLIFIELCVSPKSCSIVFYGNWRGDAHISMFIYYHCKCAQQYLQKVYQLFNKTLF